MLKIFDGIFGTTLTEGIEPWQFLSSMGAALVLGAVLAAAYAFKTKFTKSFLITVAMLPATVAVVIMMVNGNLGAGVAVAGAFSLVRFRSAPGSAKEIVTVFLAMGAGLVSGMGYLAYAALFVIVMSGTLMLYSFIGSKDSSDPYKTLRITAPEDLAIDGVFEGIFKTYLLSYELIKIKTVNMGSMYRITYRVRLKDKAMSQDLIDAIRVCNGNLEVSLMSEESSASEL